MQTYYGTMRIAAKPMTRREYNDYRGWEFFTDENGADEGYLVEYLDSPGSNHPDHEHYISWSPKAQFDAAYQPVTNMTFGHALVALQSGYKIARAGWRDKGMYLTLLDIDGNKTVMYEGFCIENSKEDEESQGGTAQDICTKTTTPEILMGWLGSRNDMFAADWHIVE